MRRGAVRQGLQEEAELRLGLCFRDVQQAEHSLLNFGLVNTNAAAADFIAIKDQVIGLRLDMPGIGFQLVPLLRHWGGEGVVEGIIALFVLIPRQQRKVDDPNKLELSRLAQFQVLPQLAA